MTETSIGDLFIAGIIPGILLTLFFMITVAVVTRIDPLAAPSRTNSVTGSRIASSDNSKLDMQGSLFKKVWATLLLFVLVIDGIYTGILFARFQSSWLSLRLSQLQLI